MPDSLPFSDWHDQQLVLVPCINDQSLPDPARCCRDWRTLSKATKTDSATMKETEYLLVQYTSLRQDARYSQTDLGRDWRFLPINGRSANGS